jgi:hypothetical protein
VALFIHHWLRLGYVFGVIGPWVDDNLEILP